MLLLQVGKRGFLVSTLELGSCVTSCFISVVLFSLFWKCAIQHHIYFASWIHYFRAAHGKCVDIFHFSFQGFVKTSISLFLPLISYVFAYQKKKKVEHQIFNSNLPFKYLSIIPSSISFYTNVFVCAWQLNPLIKEKKNKTQCCALAALRECVHCSPIVIIQNTAQWPNLF